MPNWIEGTMKLRGRREDIKRFFIEGLDFSNWPKAEDRENQVIDKSGKNFIAFQFRNEPHIQGTRRAFITYDFVYMDEDEGVVCVDVKQAWYFCEEGSRSKDIETWKSISDKFNIDIRLYGIERGMHFTQEIIILRNREPIINVKRYADWDWECPFPNMGG